MKTMTNLEELNHKRKALYQKLQKHEEKTNAYMKKARVKRSEIANELEHLKAEIQLARGAIELARETEAAQMRVNKDVLAAWLKETYAGSDALAQVSAAQVRRDYEEYNGHRVRVHNFRHAMFELGFEVKIKRVASGGGYVTRAFVRIEQ